MLGLKFAYRLVKRSNTASDYIGLVQVSSPRIEPVPVFGNQLIPNRSRAAVEKIFNSAEYSQVITAFILMPCNLHSVFLKPHKRPSALKNHQSGAVGF